MTPEELERFEKAVALMAKAAMVIHESVEDIKKNVLPRLAKIADDHCHAGSEMQMASRNNIEAAEEMAAAARKIELAVENTR